MERLMEILTIIREYDLGGSDWALTDFDITKNMLKLWIWTLDGNREAAEEIRTVLSDSKEIRTECSTTWIFKYNE